MSPSTQQLVALEFGFSERLIRRALRLKTFKTAGELVDYLDEHEEELSAIEEQDSGGATAAVVEKETPPEVTKAEEVKVDKKEVKKKPKLTLRAETEWLYKTSLCLACWKKPRTIVLLPCCHYALCSTCAKMKDKCPLNSCSEKIVEIIPTFM